MLIIYPTIYEITFTDMSIEDIDSTFWCVFNLQKRSYISLLYKCAKLMKIEKEFICKNTWKICLNTWSHGISNFFSNTPIITGVMKILKFIIVGCFSYTRNSCNIILIQILHIIDIIFLWWSTYSTTPSKLVISKTNQINIYIYLINYLMIKEFNISFSANIISSSLRCRFISYMIKSLKTFGLL